MNNPKLVQAFREVAEGLRNPDIREEHIFPQGTGPQHLDWMIDQIIANAETWPADKVGRWIGFVQGVRAARRQLDVRKERDRTRPLFHAAYGEDAPPTLERE